VGEYGFWVGHVDERVARGKRARQKYSPEQKKSFRSGESTSSAKYKRSGNQGSGRGKWA